ncbi:MAG: hypothetical protein GWN00_04875 [Aliifodinibius sp.]|nr:hypothetical protein [candidate division Zixibacteria bacterium]NIT55577.1 hypothetical protein [Fodinibius sp.]NIU13069.1 hypothetical protein [candidate division Zixibacteria bacterium]NIW43826.1 hypothetical protein [Gammaproteobacteria bacterium]NIY24161.1 hypothetical protein [Fodinibius sp.]
MQETQDKAMASLKDAQSRLEELNKEVIARINTLQDIGQKTLKEQKENLEQGLDEASEVLATEESSS